MRAMVLVAVFLSTTAVPARARLAPSLPRRLAACATLIDNLSRLTCYDRLAGGARRYRVRAASAHDHQPRLSPAGPGQTCFLFNGERVCE